MCYGVFSNSRRRKHRIPDDELPLSSKTMIELMPNLADLGVPSGGIPEER